MYKAIVSLMLLASSGCLAQPSETTEDAAQTEQSLSFWVWGGHFQIDDCGGNNVVNQMTGSTNCGDGFTQYRSNRQSDPESHCGGNDYFCAGPGVAQFPQVFYGMYQVSDCGTDWVNNPETGTLGCPSGYSSLKIGRVKVPEGSQCGATQYACLGGSFASFSRNFGGEYQVSDTGQGTTVNPLTGASNCPSGYTAKKYGRVLTAGDGHAKAGANQYYCAR